MFDQLTLMFDAAENSDDRSGGSQPPRRRAERRRDRMREVSTRITHSRTVNERRRREVEAERTLERARRARLEAQKFRDLVEKSTVRHLPTDRE